MPTLYFRTFEKSLTADERRWAKRCHQRGVECYLLTKLQPDGTLRTMRCEIGADGVLKVDGKVWVEA